MSAGTLSIVLCPMQVERRAVEREIARASAGSVRVIQTGIGAKAINDVVKRIAPERPRLVLLAGVCGGLLHGPEVPVLSRIVDEHGRSWSGFAGAAANGGATLVGVDRIVDTPLAKARLAEASGASIVDMESHAFAAQCEELGLRWGVVRGVSDTPDEMLPAEILNWITPAGDTRTGRAVIDMLRRPTHIPHIMRFARRSGRVLPAVGKRVVEVLQGD